MITILPIALGLVAGIGLYGCIFHFLVGIRQHPRNPIHLTFALLILLVTGQILADAVARSTDSLSLTITSFKIGITLVALALIALLWFVALYTRVKPRWYLLGLSGVSGFLAIVNLFTPYSVIYEEITSVSTQYFPWGEPFLVIEGTPSVWQGINILLFLLIFGYAFYAAYQQYQRGERRQALALVIALSFVIAGTIYDFLIDFGVITDFIHLYPVSYIGMVLVMSLSLSNDVIQAGVVKQQLVESEARLAGILDIAGEAVISIDAFQKIILFNKQAEDTFGYMAGEVIDQPLDMLLPERFWDIHRDHIAVFAASGDISRDMGDRQELYGRRKSGEEFVIEASISKLSVEQEQYYTVVLRDITRRKQTELELAQYREHLEEVVEERTTELTHAVEELQTLNQISRMAATVTDLPAALNLVCKTVTHQLESGSAVVRVIDSSKETMTVLARYTNNPDAEIGGEDVYPWQISSPLAQALSQGETIVLNQEEARTRLANIDPQLRDVQVTAMMIVPLRIRSDLIGLMALTCAGQQINYTDNDVALAEAVAGYVAGAIENTRLVEQMQETAVAEERNRLAQDLHDSVTQTMFSVSSIAETLPRVWERDPEVGREGLDSLRRMTQGALSEMRMLLIELRPAALLEKSLGDLLRQLADAVGARSETMITTTIAGDSLLPDRVQVALYRIAQEALNNVTKHSAATQTKLGLYCTPKQVTLEVSDNGQGFDPHQEQNRGRFGLTIMAERANDIDADFELKSQPEQGTKVTVVWSASHNEGRKTNA